VHTDAREGAEIFVPALHAIAIRFEGPTIFLGRPGGICYLSPAENERRDPAC